MFLLNLELLLTKLENSPDTVFIGGDFNLNLLKPNAITNQFSDLMSSFGLSAMVNSPTRVDKTSATCIDNIFTSDNENCDVNIIKDLLSDHFGLELIIKNCNDHNEKFVERKRKYLNENKAKKLSLILSQESWFDVYKAENGNEKCNKFLNIFMKHVDSVIPVTESCKKEKQKNNVFDDECLKYKDHVKFCHDLKQCYPQNEHFKNMYADVKQKYLTMLELCRQKYNSKKMMESDCKGKTTWAIINDSATTKKTKIANTIDEIKNKDGEIIDNPKNIAQIFNEYFANVAAELKKNIPPTRSQKKIPYTNKSMYFEEITTDEILKIIKSLKNSKSKNVFDLSTDIIKMCAPFICEPLCDVFQTCVNQGIFPGKLKISKTIPIFKKGNRNDPSNYRPIAILPCFMFGVLRRLMRK